MLEYMIISAAQERLSSLHINSLSKLTTCVLYIRKVGLAVSSTTWNSPWVT